MRDLIFDLQRFVETINGSSAHNYLQVSVGGTIVYGYSGNDSIYNREYHNVTIVGGAGADSIKSGEYYGYNTNNTSIIGGSGNDWVSLRGSNATISGDDGEDYIRTDVGNNNSVNGGIGNDTISNSGKNVTIYGGYGNDSIVSEGDNGFLNGGEDNDYIYSQNGIGMTIIGGNGDDDIFSRYNNNGSIIGGDGNDYIQIWGNTSEITINGGAGSDRVSLTSSVAAAIQYINGDGNDIVYGFTSNDTLQISGNTYSTAVSGDHVIVNVGNGSITLDSANGKTLNIVTNSVSFADDYPTPTLPPDSTPDVEPEPAPIEVSTIDGTEGHDYLRVSVGGTIVYGYSGNDSIYNREYHNVTIVGGAGADSIKSGEYYGYNTNNTSIIGGSGNDWVSLRGSNATISGDDGEDYIRTDVGNNNSVNGGIGNDTISNSGKNVTIYGGYGNDSIVSEGDNGFLNGGEDNDYIYSQDGVGTTIIGGNGDDDIFSRYNNNGSIIGGDGNDYIQIWGNTSEITINGGAGSDRVSLTSSVAAAIQYINGDGNDIVYGFTSNDTLQISGNTYSTAVSGDHVIVYVGGGSVTLDSAKGKTLNIVGSYYAPPVDNTYYAVTVNGGNGRDYFWYYGDENYLGKNFTSGMASYSDVVVLPNRFAKAYREGYNVYFEMTNGNKIKLQTDTNSSDDAIFYSGDGQTFYVAKIADQAATNITWYSGIKYYGLNQFGTLNLLNDGANHSIWLDGSDGVSYLYISNIDASANTGKDLLVGNSGNNSIIAGSGESSLWGGNGGDDTLVGGSAKNYFWFTGEGNDVVVDFTSGMASNADAAVLPENFTVSRSNNILTFKAQNGYTMQVQTDSYSGDDAILYSGDGSTFYSAKIADQTATQITHYNNIKYYGLAQWGTLNVINSSNNNIHLDGSDGVSYLYVMNVDAISSTGNNTIVGSAGYNAIRAGSGNSTLWGGEYDGTADLLIGGSGIDMFLVGKNDGNDVIQNSSYSDIINLYDVSLSEISSTKTDSENIYLSLNNGSQITIQNSDNLSAAVWTSDGGRYRYNRSSTSWQNTY